MHETRPEKDPSIRETDGAREIMLGARDTVISIGMNLKESRAKAPYTLV